MTTKIDLTKEQIEIILVALSCLDSELPEYYVVVEKLNECLSTKEE